MALRTLAVAALVALIPSFSEAQRPPQDRPAPPLRHDIVVTATRLETPEKRIGSSLTVVSGEELVRTGKAFVLDALEAALGLSTVRNGGPGATASVSVRGANSEHTLFLLDGLELNDPINPSRSYDVSHLPLSQVERIEILRGPQGLLYGSDALGGVINIITRTGRGRPRLSLASSTDTLRSVAADLSLAGSGKKTDYSFSLFHERTAGLSAASSSYAGNTEKDGYRDLSLAARIGYAPRPASHLTFTVRAATGPHRARQFRRSRRRRPEQRPGLREPACPRAISRPLPERPLGTDRLPVLARHAPRQRESHRRIPPRRERPGPLPQRHRQARLAEQSFPPSGQHSHGRPGARE